MLPEWVYQREYECVFTDTELQAFATADIEAMWAPDEAGWDLDGDLSPPPDRAAYDAAAMVAGCSHDPVVQWSLD